MAKKKTSSLLGLILMAVAAIGGAIAGVCAVVGYKRK